MSIGGKYKQAIYDEDMDRVLTVAREGADTSVQDQLGWTAFHLAAKKGDTRPFYNDLFSGCDINTRDKDGETALHFAIRYNQPETFKEIRVEAAGTP